MLLGNGISTFHALFLSSVQHFSTDSVECIVVSFQMS